MARKPQVPGGEPAAVETAPEIEGNPEAVAAAVEEAPADVTYRDQARSLRAADVDPTRIKRAVLTLDGWVCPAESPKPKARE